MPHTPLHVPLLTLDDVTLRIGDHLFFEHTTWAILTDQHWAILGPNGAGKSILANALRRQVALVRGRIQYYFDRGPDGTPAPRSYLKRGEIVAISSDSQRDLLRAHSRYHQARWQSFEGRDAPSVPSIGHPLRGGGGIGLFRLGRPLSTGVA